MVSVRRVAPVLLLLIAIPALAATPKKSSSRPPHELHRVGDHWTAWNPPDPSTYPPNSKTYTVKAGDTLWALAQQFYKNAYLWPQLWEGNTWITDAHWIYPGDVILLSGEVVVAAETAAPGPGGQPSTAGAGAASSTAKGGAGASTAATTPTASEAKSAAAASTPVPLATDFDIYCYGYIGDPNEAMPNNLSSFEDIEMRQHAHVKEQSDHAAQGDLMYIAGGTSTGLVAGDTYMLVEPGELIRHPRTRAVLGRQYQYVGQIKVLCAEETRSRGMITQSCREVPNGARLKPMPQIPIPIARIPGVPEFCDPASGKQSGYIITSRGWENGLGVNDLVQINLGREDQVQPGDFLTVFHDNMLAGQPRLVLGEIAVLTAEAHTATARVVAMRRVMAVGDMVEVR